MKGEVDGCEGGLQGGKLGTGKGAVGNYAVDEGLVDGGAEEGAIANRVVGSMDDRGVRRRGQADLMMW